MSISETFREWLLAPVIQKLKEIQKTMANDKAALDAALQNLVNVITSEDSQLATLVSDYQALLANQQANPGQDFTDEVTALNSKAADVQAQTQSIVAAIASAAGTTPPTTGTGTPTDGGNSPAAA